MGSETSSVKFEEGTNRAFCVPPPDPAAFSANDDPSSKEMMECDGPLVLNALLVVAERYSALKRARFGSETSAAALRGMCVLLCLGAGVATTTGESGMVVAQGVPGTAEPGEFGTLQVHGILEVERGFVFGKISAIMFVRNTSWRCMYTSDRSWIVSSSCFSPTTYKDREQCRPGA